MSLVKPVSIHSMSLKYITKILVGSTIFSSFSVVFPLIQLERVCYKKKSDWCHLRRDSAQVFVFHAIFHEVEFPTRNPTENNLVQLLHDYKPHYAYGSPVGRVS